MKKKINLRANEFEQYCSVLADFISENEPKTFNNGEPIYLTDTNRLPKYIKKITIVKYDFGYSFWQINDVRTITDIDFKKLNNIIINKSLNVFKYANDYSENWLLIIVEREEHSDYSQLRLDKYELSKQNKFNQIYLIAIGHRPAVTRIV